MCKQIDHEIKQNATNDQDQTILCTYNQNTYTLLYKLQWRDESKEQSVDITYLTSSDCQSSHANPFFFLLGGGAHRVRPPPELGGFMKNVYLFY